MNKMQNTLRRVRTLLVASLAIPTLAAQSVYTLDVCIDKALQNNARMQNAKNDLSMAKQQRKAAFTKYFPTVSATGMGFLADVQCSEMAQAIDEIMEGRYHIEERALLHVSDGSHAAWPYALNEVAVLKLDTSSMITIHAYLDGSFLNTYQADGLLVATPTGSTGYSLSVGGPIVAPNAANFIITPVAPHSLNVRPLVIGDNAEITLVAEGRNRHFLVSLDGRSEEKYSGESITLRKAPFPIRIIKRDKHLFTDTLRKKLMWGVDLRSNG